MRAIEQEDAERDAFLQENGMHRVKMEAENAASLGEFNSPAQVSD